MEQKKPIVSLEVCVHWGDMDAMQHVNNIIYLKWVESTRLLLFEQLMKGETAGVAEIGYFAGAILSISLQWFIQIPIDFISSLKDRLECQAHFIAPLKID